MKRNKREGEMDAPPVAKKPRKFGNAGTALGPTFDQVNIFAIDSLEMLRK